MASPTQIESMRSGPACDVLPVPPARQLPDGHADPVQGLRDIARTYTTLAAQAVEFARLSAIRAFYRARHGAVRGSSRAAYSAQRFIRQTQDRARNVQRQHPVRVLGVLAGTAFLAGAIIRIWRSRAR